MKLSRRIFTPQCCFILYRNWGSDERLTTSQVRSFYSVSTFRKGEDYYLSYDSKSQSWVAMVSGTKTYHVSIKVQNQYIEDECTCKAYESYGDCKHTCVAMLAIANEQKIDSKQNNGSKMLDTSLRNI